MKNKAFFRVLLTALSAALLLACAGCADAIPGADTPDTVPANQPDNETQDNETPENETPENVMLNTVSDFFTSIHPNKTAYIVITGYDDLTELYGVVKAKPATFAILKMQGNVGEAETANLYTPEYFESGYLIAMLIQTPSGSYTHRCSAAKADGIVTVSVTGIYPPVQTADIGGYIMLVPVEGRYGNETIETVRANYQVTEVGATVGGFTVKDGMLEINFNGAEPAMNTASCVITGENLAAVKGRGITGKLTAGIAVRFGYTWVRQGDTTVQYIVALSVGGETLLDFDTGFAGFLNSLSAG